MMSDSTVLFLYADVSALNCLKHVIIWTMLKQLRMCFCGGIRRFQLALLVLPLQYGSCSSWWSITSWPWSAMYWSSPLQSFSCGPMVPPSFTSKLFDPDMKESSILHGINLVFSLENEFFLQWRSPPCIPEVSIPEEPVLQFASVLRLEINCAVAVLREIASGRDLKKFLAVCWYLWLVS